MAKEQPEQEQKDQATQEKEQKDLSLSDAVKQLAAKLAKQHGRGIIGIASGNSTLDVARIPTGIFALDYALGGGLPKGRMSKLFGDWSSGKSLVALKLVATAQQMCREHNLFMLPTEKSKHLLRCPVCGSRSFDDVCNACSSKEFKQKRIDFGDKEIVCPKCKQYNPHIIFWADMEGSYYNRWATLLGVNHEHLVLTRPEYAEQLVDVYEMAWRTLKIDISVVDSIAMMTPFTETEESLEKSQQGLQARLVNKFMRKATSIQNSPEIHASERWPTQIFINQTREKIGVMFQDPTVQPGGKGQDFVTSIDVRLWRSKTLLDPANETEPILSLCRFAITKNKVGIPKRKGAFRIWHQDYGGSPAGWINEPLVVARALTRALLGLSPNGDVVEINKVAETLPIDKAKLDFDKLRALCISKDVILSEKAAADMLQKSPGLWWDARERLLHYRLGAIEEDLDEDIEGTGAAKKSKQDIA